MISTFVEDTDLEREVEIRCSHVKLGPVRKRFNQERRHESTHNDKAVKQVTKARRELEASSANLLKLRRRIAVGGPGLGQAPLQFRKRERTSAAASLARSGCALRSR